MHDRFALVTNTRDFMELQRYFAIFRRRRRLIIITVIVAMVTAYFVTSTENEYTAQAVIYVGKQQLSIQDISGDRALGTDRIVATYAAMIETKPIAQLALERTGLPFTSEEVVEKTTAYAVPPTFLLRIQVTDTDPTVARDLTNGLADAFVDRIQDFDQVTPTTSTATTARTTTSEGNVPSGGALPAYVFKSADLPTAPLPVDTLRNLVLSAILGLLAAVGISLALDYLDVTIKSVVDVEERLGIITLAVIPEHGELASMPAPMTHRQVFSDG